LTASANSLWGGSHGSTSHLVGSEMLLFLIMEADVTVMELFRHEHIGFVFVGQVKTLTHQSPSSWLLIIISMCLCLEGSPWFCSCGSIHQQKKMLLS